MMKRESVKNWGLDGENDGWMGLERALSFLASSFSVFYLYTCYKEPARLISLANKIKESIPRGARSL
jgi:hypothetical protein